MMCFRKAIGLLMPTVLVAVGSCTPIRPEGGKSPLARAQMSPDSCVLDIFLIRFPFGDEEANGPMWNEIDEQHFPSDLRRRLAQNGFRVGLVGGQMPLKLAQMLELEGKPASSGECQQVSLESLQSTPKVMRRHLQLPAGQRRPIPVSDVYEEWPVLQNESGGLCGRSYPDAQGVFGIEAYPAPDGRVRLELVPELHYGRQVQRYVGRQGAFRLETSRPRRVFDDMTLSSTLTAGEMLVVSGLPNRPGSVGHHFFTLEDSGQKEQKLLLIRLSQTQHDDLFDPNRVLPLEDFEVSENTLGEPAGSPGPSQPVEKVELDEPAGSPGL